MNRKGNAEKNQCVHLEQYHNGSKTNGLISWLIAVDWCCNSLPYDLPTFADISIMKKHAYFPCVRKYVTHGFLVWFQKHCITGSKNDALPLKDLNVRAL